MNHVNLNKFEKRQVDLHKVILPKSATAYCCTLVLVGASDDRNVKIISTSSGAAAVVAGNG
jgi:hypothetical protein